jgi:CheY-like chemotaxis protein
MPRGGTVLVETGRATVTPATREGRTGVPEGVYSTLTVRDSGCGMTEEVMARMFDPFFSTKEPGKGTGLGLCTVHDIVRRCNGYIRVASKPGVGSRFRVFFPLAQGPTLPAPEAKKPEPKGQSAGMVLVAEDSPSLRGVAVMILRQQGYQVLEASNGAEALSLADGHPGPIDVLFTDVRMPKMSGPELVTALTNRRPNLRVVYTSGYAECNLPASSRPMLLKPYWPDELLDAVGAAINAPMA